MSWWVMAFFLGAGLVGMGADEHPCPLTGRVGDARQRVAGFKRRDDALKAAAKLERRQRLLVGRR